MAADRLTKVIRDIRAATRQDAASLSDGQLLDHFIEHKDEAAFALLIRRHGAMVWGVCRRALARHHDAEDAFQATFLVLARKAASVRPREMVANWLYGVAHRTALKARATDAKRRTREKQVMTMPEPEAAPQDSWPNLETLIDQELAGLPDKYRVAVVLCDLEGKIGKDAARQLNIPEGTLASRLRTGRGMLAKRLSRHGLVLSGGALETALSQNASACAPAALAAATVKAATMVAAGQTVTTAIVSAKVAALAEGVVKAMLLSKLKLATAMLVVFALTLGAGGFGRHLFRGAPLATAQGQEKKEAPKGLDHLLKLAPAERMRVLGNVVDKDKDFVSATRGPLTGTIVERGSLGAVESTDLVCKVRTNVVGATVKWVIDDGSHVKKGDKLIELDSSAHADLLRKQQEVVAKAENEQKRAADTLERVRNENRIDVKLAELDLRLAELALRHYKFDEPLKRETLAVQVDRAALLVERVKLQGPPKLEKASDLFYARKSACERERDRQREIEKDIANCVMTAPRDGVVSYYVPEEIRFGPGREGRQAVVAVGEPVVAGQKLLRISDLKRMAVNTRVHEALISKVRGGQAAKVRVDAYPGRAFTGNVSEVATVANQADWLSSAMKVYNVMISVDGDNKDLRPGMTAECTILVGEQPNCLRLPASAALRRGNETYCYVLAGNELQVRKVTVGLSDGKLAEILSGLKEGDLILRDPSEAALRLTGSLRKE
jgi:RND family efflux transporter MFP subunit